jgi:hypothetical protein
MSNTKATAKMPTVCPTVSPQGVGVGSDKDCNKASKGLKGFVILRVYSRAGISVIPYRTV